VLIGTATGLLLLALPLLWQRRVMLASLFMGLIAVLGLSHLSGGLANPCDRESNYFCIRVVDAELAPEFGEVRSMILDHLSHGSNVKDEPTLLVAPYVHAMDELVRDHFEDTRELRYFFAGGGAYTHPRAVQAATPQAEIHVAELDAAVTEVARQQLYLDPHGMTIHHLDARPALAAYPEKHFDVIVGDVFHDIAIPYHLVTREFLHLVKTRLKPEGLY